MENSIQERIKKQRANINPDIKTHYTPESLVKYCLSLVNYNENDFILDVGSGLNMVWYNNFNTKNKDWVEIEKGKDFFNYTQKVDYCIGNPPYKNLMDYIFKALDLSNKGVYFLVDIHAINRLTPKRLDLIEEKGFYITKITIVNVSKWFGRYFFIEFTKDKNKSILNWSRETFKDEFTKEKELKMENKDQLYIDREEYVFNLLKKSNKAGELKPEATLKIIMFNVMEKYKLTQDETCELIGRVITDYNFTKENNSEIGDKK